MAWTKRQIIDAAYEEIGLGSYEFDLAPEQIQSALSRLDAMMADWNMRGVRIGYPLESSPLSGDIDADSGIPDWCVQAVVSNLGIRLAPTIGRQVMRETKAAAHQSYMAVLSALSEPISVLMPTMPSGAGNKPWRTGNPFTAPDVEPLLAGGDGPIDLE